MLVSFNWIKEFIDTGLSAEETANALTMTGLEVEGLDKQDDGDYVLEVNVTPNRPDCLSVLGIARELHAITGKTLKPPPYAILNEAPTQFNIEIQDKDLCARYTGRVVKGLKVAESPDWLKTRLERSGIRAVNNVVDTTNYVLLELGHPLHAFDLDTLEGGAIKVAVAGKDQKIITIDGVERKLPEDALLIWDGKRPVAVAGVMGGIETEVRNSTKDILIESAWFKPQSVRKTSKALGLKSESSYRFERGTDVLGLETALDRAALLISQLAGGTVEFKIDVYPVKYSPEPITMRYEKISRSLGTEITHEEITGILGKLDLEIQQVTQETFVVTSPSFRPDLTMDADIMEEVARLYGYGKIPTTMPITDISSTGGVLDRRMARAKDAMRKEGLNEAINYSFMNENYLDVLKIPDKDSRRKTVHIKNPLRAEDAVLRTMLVPSLIENFLYNFNRGTKDIRLFEIARVFEDTGEKLPKETLKLGGISFAERKPNLWKEPSPDFYQIKGALESLFHTLRAPEPEFKKPTEESFLHPGKSADIYLKGKRAGFIGELSPDILENLDVKTKTSLNLCELDMDVLLSSARESVTYSQIPRYPAIERDISLVVDEEVQAADIAALIRSYPGEFIEEVSVFDTFTGKNIPTGKKSLAFSIRYRSPERTLTDEEVEKIHEGIVKHITEKTGGQVRA
jgi:phenylalanyl-tRNA synthetase beta chain